MLKKNILESFSKEETLKRNNFFWEYLSKNAYPLTKGEIRLPISLEPFEISNSDYENLQKKLNLVISSAKKVVNLYFESNEIQDLLEVSNYEKSLIESSKHEDFLGIIRADLFYSKNPKIVELNTDFPDGFFMHDVTSEALLFNLDKEIHSRFSHSSMFSRLLEDMDFSKESQIFIGFNKDRFFKDEFELSRIELNNLGYKNVFVGAIEDLDFREDNYFYFNNKRIDLLRRCSEISKFRENKNLVNNFKKSKTKVLNNFKMRLLGHKSLLSLLHNKNVQKNFNQEEISAIKSLIPKTLMVDEVENIDTFIEEKDSWVLKASDLAEGDCVYLGNEISSEKWKELLIFSKENPKLWVLQELVEIPEAEFTLIDEKSNDIKKEIKKFDFNPHLILFKDKIEFGNILVRFSNSSVLNVMKGGGITYTLIKKD